MSRAHILATLRAGLAAAPLDVSEPPARPASCAIGPDAWKLLAEVLAPLDVRLRLAATPAEAARHVADIARERRAASYTRWQELPAGLGLNVLDLDAALAGLTRLTYVRPECCQALAQVDLGLTFAQAALLDSGSLALVAEPGRERAVSLLPPTHICLVPRSALAPDVSVLPELLERHRDPSGQLPSCLNLVTGPSSTADIELVLVRGVHGPGALEVLGLDWETA
ncbi:MAG: LUD domain-containing protein [Humidesulfovibrio sp.]|nr:LUD domain-containing protein [Humidesulfovibrio sp.]